MVVRAALVVVFCMLAVKAAAIGVPGDPSVETLVAQTRARAEVVQVTPSDFGMTVDASVGAHVMARLNGIVTFYFDRARLSGSAVKNVYVSGGPGSYVVWFRIAAEGGGSLHLPFFSIDEQTKTFGGLDLTIKAAPGRPPNEPIWIELPTAADRNSLEVEVPSGNTVFLAWPLVRSADVLDGVEITGVGVEKLMDPRWMHVLGEHEGEWLVTMVEAVAPGAAAIKFGNGKTVTIHVTKGTPSARRPSLDKTI